MLLCARLQRRYVRCFANSQSLMPPTPSPEAGNRWHRALPVGAALIVALLVKFGLGGFDRPSPKPSSAELKRQREIAEKTAAALDAVDAQKAAMLALGGPRVYAASQRLAESVARDPKFVEALANQQTGAPRVNLPVKMDPGQELSAQLVAQGSARLPADEFLEMVKLRLKMAEGSPTICAGFWSGGLLPSDMGRSLEALGDADFQRWFELSERAMRLQLYATTPLPRFSGKAFVQGAREILAPLPDAERAAHMKTMDAGLAAPPAEGCSTYLVLVRGGIQLPSTRRDAFLRALSLNSMVDWEETPQSRGVRTK